MRKTLLEKNQSGGGDSVAVVTQHIKAAITIIYIGCQIVIYNFVKLELTFSKKKKKTIIITIAKNLLIL